MGDHCYGEVGPVPSLCPGHQVEAGWVPGVTALPRASDLEWGASYLRGSPLSAYPQRVSGHSFWHGTDFLHGFLLLHCANPCPEGLAR